MLKPIEILKKVLRITTEENVFFPIVLKLKIKEHLAL